MTAQQRKMGTCSRKCKGMTRGARKACLRSCLKKGGSAKRRRTKKRRRR